MYIKLFEEYTTNESNDDKSELISDLLLEYSEKWNLNPSINKENEGRYLVIIDFETMSDDFYLTDYPVDNIKEYILISKVNESNLSEFKSDIELFTKRMKKWNCWCVVNWRVSDGYDSNYEEGETFSVWLYIDFNTSD